MRRFQSCFERFVITKIPREENIRADEFSKIASGTEEEIEASGRQIIVLTEPSIAPRTKVMEADSAPDEPQWARDIIQFLKNGLLPEDKVTARRVKIQAARLISLELFDSRPLYLHLLDLVCVVYITFCYVLVFSLIFRS